ncbi:MAG TPA: T9SS type A sorting domain-containing protein [Ignavibacteria bacterium]|nr:T9SS type A sorting domain-containing protein [Ignavibacteria bacterium]HRA99802.1 T9SS type A sorting domain-containing protein [Ignavibacteria bacterium]
MKVLFTTLCLMFSVCICEAFLSSIYSLEGSMNAHKNKISEFDKQKIFNSILFQNSNNLFLNIPKSFADNSTDAKEMNNISNTCSTSWESVLTCVDANNKRDSVKIGKSVMGSIGIDTCLGEYLIPPAPPEGIYDFRIVFPPTYTLDASKTDIRWEGITQATFWLYFQPSVNGPLTFSWDSTSFPDSSIVLLKEEINGITIDMKKQKQFVINNSGIRYLKVEYKKRKVSYIQVINGWNITSIPLLNYDMSISHLFDSDVSTSFSYNNGYNNANILTNSVGYWIKFPADKNYLINGDILINKEINVITGWNIIGPFEEKIPVSGLVTDPPGLLASPFFGYENGYFSEDTLLPGKGYWIKSNDTGKFYLDTNIIFNRSNPVNKENSFTDWVRIEISDNSGSVSNLYLAEENEIISDYELPPVPPTGIFDSRFVSNKCVESIEHDNLIQINSVDRPVILKAYNLKGKQLKIQDNIGGSLLNELLSENISVRINNSLDKLLITSESNLPLHYELSQNYPNPFNPSTTIDYQIPNNGNVKLIIYNILGQEINILLNEFKQSGRYNVEFNAADLSSGIYFYKIESGSFNEIKSMILLK